MSVNLNCPNCGRTVGHAEAENNYKEVYYYVDENGCCFCPACNPTIDKKKIIKYFVVLLIALSIYTMSILSYEL